MTSVPEPDLARRLHSLPAVAALRERLGDRDDVWIVGGAIRDLLLGAEPVDLDLVVDGELGPVVAALGAPSRLHDRFGTATVDVAGIPHDIARARRERYPRPGALPEVEPADLAEDLRRRDFTVNAIAARLSDGRIRSVAGALDDLAGGRLRVLHDESFRDDPTRLLRLARYAGRLHFAPEPRTARLLAEAVAAGALGTVSGHRVGGELVLLAAEADPVAGLESLHRLGIDEAVAPGFGLADPAAGQRLRRALALLPPDGDRVALALGAALTGVAPDRRPELLERLGLPAGRRDAALAAADAGPLAAPLAAARLASEVAAAVDRAPIEAVALAGGAGGRSEQAAREWLEVLRHITLEIGGHDLIEAGLPPGPQIGAALARARAARLDGRAPDRAAQLEAALGSDREPG